VSAEVDPFMTAGRLCMVLAFVALATAARGETEEARSWARSVYLSRQLGPHVARFGFELVPNTARIDASQVRLSPSERREVVVFEARDADGARYEGWFWLVEKPVGIVMWNPSDFVNPTVERDTPWAGTERLFKLEPGGPAWLVRRAFFRPIVDPVDTQQAKSSSENR
jgi:hypothetical protein